MKYFDAHSHVSFSDFDADRDAVLERMKEKEVGTLTVGVDLESSKKAIEFSEGKDDFYATIGLHPNDTPTESFDSSIYGTMVSHPKVVGVGECGLDYFRVPAFASASAGGQAEEKRRQLAEFERQMQFAIQHNKPLMIHCRPSKGTMDAYEDLLVILESEQASAGERLRGNSHFFVGNVDIAKRFWELGFTTSFTGVLTFTHDYDEVVKAAPLDMLLTETDCPYATPAPHRGTRNEPSYVTYVVDAIAQIRGSDHETVRAQILENARRVFAIPDRA